MCNGMMFGVFVLAMFRFLYHIAFICDFVDVKEEKTAPFIPPNNVVWNAWSVKRLNEVVNTFVYTREKAKKKRDKIHFGSVLIARFLCVNVLSSFFFANEHSGNFIYIVIH